jgi:uncharacterized OB-fold protein
MEHTSAGMWRRINARYNLIGSECQNCKRSYFPPRIVCKECGRNTVMKEKRFSGNGTVYSYSRIYVPPDAFKDDAPYTVGVVKLEEGPMVEGHIIENGKKIEVGTEVRTVFRKMRVEGEEGLVHYHFKFEPI